MTGLIKYPKRIKQLINYSGIQFDKIRPSDIDGVLEFDNRFLFLLEFKHIERKHKSFKDFNRDGQNIMLKRIIDSWQYKDKKEGFVVYLYHKTKPHEDIMAEKTCVHGYYHKRQYYKIKMPLLDFLFEMGCKHDIEKITAEKRYI